MDHFPSQASFCFAAETLYPKILPFYFPGVSVVGSSAVSCEPVMRQGGGGMWVQHLVDSYVGYITNFTNGNFTNGTQIFTNGFPPEIF